MKNLLFKEFKLVITWPYYLTVLFSLLILIPNWVYFVAMMYLFFVAIPNIFTNAKAMNDIGLTMMLPVRKSDVVKARILSVATLEVLQILSGAVFAIINIWLYSRGNALIDANIAYLGCVFIMYGLYNVIFFPMFYSSAYKILWPCILASLAAVLFAFGIETLVVTVPAAAYVLDGTSSAALIRQLPVLAVGIVLFVLMNLFAYKKSANNFEKVDL